MLNTNKILIKCIATIGLVAMFFSCTNTKKEVQDFLADKNLPIAVGKNINHVYKDSGKVTSKLITPVLHDFTNRKEHPYNEFPNGIEIVSYENNGKDSVTITGNYARTYGKTSISEIRDNVVIINHNENSKLETNQLFWDQKEKYFFTEDGFRLTNPTDTINGYGFESKQDLTKWIAKDITGEIQTKEEEL
ncbi:LPS export ABC transporter protein LptC [Tenacibaculum sp. MAR_2009_124]|uniref:LPS export ABC transporter periplasmic protein LptC n=1 Tax=Tenacibaculum sp. MAR_2009_124 TaxID=1250059 RepID=UPI000899FC3A|nr:LPS export ABC transporter periplasmic protein LptC [Tenacibaculum sp. MAR_2009_124]SEC80525.1 LPS export ABC transporter protein LptC [Tenacibaculum sp. MAR_2009_124]